MYTVSKHAEIKNDRAEVTNRSVYRGERTWAHARFLFKNTLFKDPI
jgi:hypothetical protein